MNRTGRFKAVSWGVATIMMLAALWQLVIPLTASFDPVMTTTRFDCHQRCRAQTDPVRLLDKEIRPQAWRTPSIESRILKRLESHEARGLIVAALAMRALPFFFFFFALAMAALGFARGGSAGRSLKWMRRSALAALIWVVADPIGHALNSKATMAVLTGREEIHIGIDLAHFILGLVIAGVAWLFIWVLEEALALQADLRDYI